MYQGRELGVRLFPIVGSGNSTRQTSPQSPTRNVCFHRTMVLTPTDWDTLPYPGLSAESEPGNVSPLDACHNVQISEDMLRIRSKPIKGPFPGTLSPLVTDHENRVVYMLDPQKGDKGSYSVLWRLRVDSMQWERVPVRAEGLERRKPYC